MTKKRKTTLILCAALLLAAVVWVFAADRIGVPWNSLEADARASQQVPDSWSAVADAGEHLAGIIFYPETPEPGHEDQHIFSIYGKNGWTYYGGFFRGGGSLGSIGLRIAVYEEDGERVYLSMNAQGAHKAVFADGWTVPLAENQPFVLAVPQESGEATFYDTEDNVLEVDRM